MGALPRSLPDDSDSIYNTICSLDYVWTDGDYMSLLEGLKTSVANLKSFLKTEGVLDIIIAEYFISDNDPELIRYVIEWCECACFNKVGRADARSNIVKLFSSRPSKNEKPPVLTTPRNAIGGVETFITPNSSKAPQVNSTYSEGNSVKHEHKDIDDQIRNATKRATQLLKNSQIALFDGTSNPSHYAIFKFEISELVDASGTHQSGLVAFECILIALRGVALQQARSIVAEWNLYHDDNRVNKLWSHLDNLYLTAEAQRATMELFTSCTQKKDESLSSYVTRFQRIISVMKKMNQNQLDDTSLIIKFSAGITCTPGLMARGLVENQKARSLSEYCLQLINTAKSMDSVLLGIPTGGRPNIVQNNIGATTSKATMCLRCGHSGHTIAECKTKVKYPCKHCGSNEHFNRMCHSKNKREKIKSEIADVGNIESQLLAVEVNNTIVQVSCNTAAVTDDRLIDQSDPMIRMSIYSKSGLLEQNCLLDTGAGANFISLALAKQLIAKAAIDKDALTVLNSPINITYGNKSTESAKCVVPIKLRSTDECDFVEILAIVTATSAYPLIIGRTGLKQLGLFSGNQLIGLNKDVSNNAMVTSTGMIAQNTITGCTRTPLTGVIVGPGERKQLQAHLPVIESAMIIPYRAPRRRRSIIDMQIIQKKLQTMIDQGKIERCESHDAHLVHEIVLVDKQADLRLPRIEPSDTESLRRYRVTLDLRAGNELELVDIGSDKMALLPKQPKGKNKPTKGPTEHQAQVSAMDIIKQLPADAKVFGKIDLDDAYSSVLVAPDLRSLFCYACPDDSGVIRYYRWKCLVQGWKYSPLLFSVAVEYLLNIYRNTLKDKTGIHIHHYQDDILIAGQDEDTVKKHVMGISEIFSEHSFVLNPKKTSISDSAVFCGYKLTSSGVIPYPKSPIPSDFSNHVWQCFLNGSDEQKISLLRSCSGKFNYYAGYLLPPQLESLRLLYRGTSLLLKQDPQVLEPTFCAQIKDAIFSLCEFILGGMLPVLQPGAVKNSFCSLLITDANVDGYCGILFRVVPGRNEEYPELSTLFESLHDQLPDVFPHADLTLIPVRITGGQFTQSEKKQSSTFRERVCQLRCVDTFYSLFSGPVVVVSDNQNVGRTWHDLDETLSYGANLVPWQRYIAVVSHIVWIPRTESLLSFVDFLARLFPASGAIHNCAITSDSDPSQCFKLVNNNPDTSLCSHDPRVSSVISDMSLPQPLFNHKQALIDLYSTDTSKYMSVSMNLIYEYVTHGGSASVSVQRLASRFVLHEGLLFHIRSTGDIQFYIPVGGNLLFDNGSGSFRAFILHHFHDTRIGMHRGYRQLVPTISEKFWWPSLLKDCTDYVKSCNTCQLAKLRFTKYKGTLRSITPSHPLSCWVIDFAGPLRTVSPEPNYILVAVCAFSSYVVTVPMVSCSAHATAAALFEHIVCRYGVPVDIYSDRGGSFDSQVIQQLSQFLGMTWHLSGSYSPRTQGLAERFIQDMKTCLTLLDFSISQLPLITFYHNTSLVNKNLLTPYEVVFGLRPNISPLLQPSEISSDDLSRLVIEARLTWSSFRSFMRDRQTDAYALRSPIMNFTVDEMVYRVYVSSSRKVVRTGPFKIIGKPSTNTYQLDGIDYPVPEYQLHPVVERPNNLQFTEPETTDIDMSSRSPTIQGKVGDLIIFETYEHYDGGIISIDVGEWVSRHGDFVTVIRYWYNHDNQWIKWDDEYHDVHIQDIKIVGFKLTTQKHIPHHIQRRLLR